MTSPPPARREFLAVTGRVLASAGILAISRPWYVSAGTPDPKVFEGREVFDRLLTLARERRWSELPIGERIGAIGMALRQTPYVASTLELYDDREVCSVDLRGLDCVTFFELALAFARVLKRGERTPDALLAEVSFLRYRGGQLTDYASRLHYLSDWFADNQAKRVVRLITPELPGAERFTRRVSFMSAHPGAYRQLKASPDQLAKIALMEAEINARTIFYLPKEKVAAAQRLLITATSSASPPRSRASTAPTPAWCTGTRRVSRGFCTRRPRETPSSSTRTWRPTWRAYGRTAASWWPVRSR